MTSQSNFEKKISLRSEFLSLRKKISDDRKQFASKQLFHSILNKIESFPKILSFWNFNEEIDLTLLNRYLATTQRLFLPLRTGKNLRIFSISDLNSQIFFHPSGFAEPIAEKCEEIDPSKLSLILVPGIAFDQSGYRLGYGKGYYDRFLASLNSSIPIWGIGFKEQLIPKLPIEENDIPVKELLLH